MMIGKIVMNVMAKVVGGDAGNVKGSGKIWRKMLNSLRDRLYNEWLMWQYAQETNPHSVAHLFLCLKSWWKMRPRTTLCQICKNPLWSVGKKDYVYCSKECADYGHIFGPMDFQEDNEEIPF